MEIKEHSLNGARIAEVISEDIIIQNADDALDIMGNIYYQGFDSIILYQTNITPEFFDLKNRIAGEILQKFSNYRVRLVIIGDFSNYENKSLKGFIYESNNGKLVNFLPSISEALKALTK